MPIDALNMLQNLPSVSPPQVYGKKPKSGFFGGTPAYTQQFARFNPQQLGAQQNLLGQGLQNTNPDILTQRAQDNFYKNTVPTLAERFTSMGAGGQNSSAFQNALGEAGVGLEGELAGLRSNLGLQQLMHGLTQGYDTVHTPRQGGFLENLLSNFATPQGIASLGSGAAGMAGTGGLSSLLPFLSLLLGSASPRQLGQTNAQQINQ